MIWTIRFIAVCLLLTSSLQTATADQCRFCHAPTVTISGSHDKLSCRDCHLVSGNQLLSDPSDRLNGSSGCVQCHQGYQRMYMHAMGSREKEKAFIGRSYARVDRAFEQKNCSGCHLSGCRDCHGSGHSLKRPKADTCSKCHKGYFVGWDYFGRAPRDEHERYQRGLRIEGEAFLKMLPDVHQQRGMICNDCHSMQSLLAGKTAARGCTDCHRPSPKIIEHRIAAHLEKLECAACHAAWASQEYGSFFLQFSSGSVEDPYLALQYTRNGYAKSVYLKRQDLPPLGVNSRGRVAPIRPQFIAYYSNLGTGRAVGPENRLLAAEWRAFAPHTIQRGTVMCDGCHDNPRRFLLERPQDRIYDLQKDGMGLYSFWNQGGQRMVNGSFIDQLRYKKISSRSADYKRAYVEKWKQLAGPGVVSSPR